MEGIGYYLGTLSLFVLLHRLQPHNLHKEKQKKSLVDDLSTVSAPGKALIAGGYLILERENIGITIAASSRFYSTVTVLKSLPSRQGTNKDNLKDKRIDIIVESPQFHLSYVYIYHYHTNTLVAASSQRNDFVEKCLSIVLSFAHVRLGADFISLMESVEQKGKLGIKLRADNDFYSQIAELRSRNKALLSENLKDLPSFNPCRRGPDGRAIIEKTGMGSSAAMTTALVGSLLQWLGIVRLGSRHGEDDRKLLHNLAQLAHSIAQGKIGSGFDVAAAVYGSQLYQRFEAANFQACMDGHATPQQLYEAITNDKLWTQKIVPFSLPPGIEIIMGDVCAGSSSTSMAKEVLRWRKENPTEANNLWASLGVINQRVYDSIQRLSLYSKTDPVAYNEAIDAASSFVYGLDEIPHVASGESAYISNELATLHFLFIQQRQYLRKMGESAGVGIEPPQQTTLLNATLGLAGVVAAGVPGAGGVDAVFSLLVVGTKSQSRTTVRNAVEQLWSTWDQLPGAVGSVCPLMLTVDTGITSGVRLENSVVW